MLQHTSSIKTVLGEGPRLQQGLSAQSEIKINSYKHTNFEIIMISSFKRISQINETTAVSEYNPFVPFPSKKQS